MVDTHNRYHATPEAVKVCLSGTGHALLRLRPVAARPHMEALSSGLERTTGNSVARPSPRFMGSLQARTTSLAHGRTWTPARAHSRVGLHARKTTVRRGPGRSICSDIERARGGGLFGASGFKPCTHSRLRQEQLRVAPRRRPGCTQSIRAAGIQLC